MTACYLYTFHDIVNTMATSTISARLDEEELALLDSLGELSGFDRSTVLKSILRKGMKDWRREIAMQKYRDGEVSLSRAAEIAGVSQWDLLNRMEIDGTELRYGREEFEEDLQSMS